MASRTKRELNAALVEAARLVNHYAWPTTTRSRSQVRWLLFMAGRLDLYDGTEGKVKP